MYRLLSQLLLLLLSQREALSFPRELQGSSADFPETRDTFVHYPSEAAELLSREMASIRSPLVLDVVTSVTHWKNPMWDLLKGLVHRFRNQNQIIYVRAHLFVGNGLLSPYNCRIEQVDPVSGTRNESAVDSEVCRRQCTNGGRYCAPEIPQSFAAEPRFLVEETLRRLCIDEIYHTSDLKHWEYLEHFEEEQCFTDPEMTECAKRALAMVEYTDWNVVENCTASSGGLDGDVLNEKLQEEVDRQQGSYTMENIPMLHIEGNSFEGPFVVAAILEQVCGTYEKLYGVTPVACEFCLPCEDVRRCLWYLECDGNPFDVNSLHDPQIQATQTTPPPVEPAPQPTVAPQDSLPPSEDTSPPGEALIPPGENDATPSPVNNDSPPATEPPHDANNSKQHRDPSISRFFMGGLMAGLIVGIAPAFYFSRHEKQTRQAISAALSAREAAAALAFRQGAYSDDLEWSAGKPDAVTQEEMIDLEEIGLEDVVAAVTNQAPPAAVGTTTTTTTTKKKMLKASGLNKIV